jgi:hypothetical protein
MKRTTICTVLEPFETSSASVSRNSIGGTPFLSPELSWPTCACGEKMVLFLQFEIRPEFDLPFAPQSQFLFFMCPVHNDCAEQWPGGVLPEEYWKERKLYSGQNPGYELLLCSGALPSESGSEPHLRAIELHRRQTVEVPDQTDSECVRGLDSLKIGGLPHWAQETVEYRCSCGAEMAFLCQIPLDYGFPKAKGAEKQPDSFSSNDYCIFLGNETYVFACSNQCTPRSLVAVCQN